MLKDCPAPDFWATPERRAALASSVVQDFREFLVLSAGLEAPEASVHRDPKDKLERTVG